MQQQKNESWLEAEEEAMDLAINAYMVDFC